MFEENTEELKYERERQQTELRNAIMTNNVTKMAHFRQTDRRAYNEMFQEIAAQASSLMAQYSITDIGQIHGPKSDGELATKLYRTAPHVYQVLRVAAQHQRGQY